jgi:hypothetical protein
VDEQRRRHGCEFRQGRCPVMERPHEPRILMIEAISMQSACNPHEPRILTAISMQGRSSSAISGPSNWQSSVISGPSEAIKYTHLPHHALALPLDAARWQRPTFLARSLAALILLLPSRSFVKSNQEQSRAVKSNQEPSRAIKSHQEQSRAINSKHLVPSRRLLQPLTPTLT